MKFFRFFLVIILVGIASLILPNAEALEFTPLSDTFVKDIQTRFSSAKTPDLEILKRKKVWTCTLYGMRSRMQSTKKQNFYSFNQLDPEENLLKNNGAQVISDYYYKSNSMEGQVGPLKDRVRMTDSGELISEISLPDREDKSTELTYSANKKVYSVASSDRTVVAYSVCN